MNSVLSINDYSVFCHLGCLPEEQKQAQEVRVSVRIEFSTAPMACESDELVDTVCYADLCEEIKMVASQKYFKTVEHLSHQIYKGLQKKLPTDIKWQLSLHKVNPPVDGLRQGVHFQIGNVGLS